MKIGKETLKEERKNIHLDQTIIKENKSRRELESGRTLLVNGNITNSTPESP